MSKYDELGMNDVSLLLQEKVRVLSLSLKDFRHQPKDDPWIKETLDEIAALYKRGGEIGLYSK